MLKYGSTDVRMSQTDQVFCSSGLVFRKLRAMFRKMRLERDKARKRKKPTQWVGFSIFQLRRIWWRETDSNHRRQCRQIYSLLPLATREPLQGVSYFSQSKPKLMFSHKPINQVVLLTLKRGKKKYGGGRRIRTIEGSAGRFTVCSLWPLGNPSRVIFPNS